MAHRPSPRLLLITGLVVFIIITLTFVRQAPPLSPEARAPGHVDKTLPNVDLSEKTLEGGVVMSKLGNATAKAELGRASWKLFHTMMARFPDKPAKEEQEALRSYIYLFARLYPCGECASHFQQHLKKFPPQVSSRSSAAGWACHVHNEVNKMLHKEIFDCSKIGDFYDCGCAHDEEEENGKDSHGSPAQKPEVAGDSTKLTDQDTRTPVKINAEPQTEG